MNALIRFLSGRAPRIESGRILRRDGMLCVSDLFGKMPERIPFVPPTSQSIVLKDSRSVTAYLFGIDGDRFRRFVKIYKFRGIIHSIKYAFRTPRAFRCFAAAEALIRADFVTPEPLSAIVELRFGIFPVSQTLVTRAVQSKDGFLDREMEKAPSAEAAQAILWELAGFVARLHQAGILHGDLSLRNIYRVPGDKKFGLIDLDGLLIARMPLRRAAAVNELARILASAFLVAPALRDRDACVREVLKSYRDAGGMEFRPEDLFWRVQGQARR